MPINCPTPTLCRNYPSELVRKRLSEPIQGEVESLACVPISAMAQCDPSRTLTLVAGYDRAINVNGWSNDTMRSLRAKAKECAESKGIGRPESLSGRTIAGGSAVSSDGRQESMLTKNPAPNASPPASPSGPFGKSTAYL
jgi:hypothetical protein